MRILGLDFGEKRIGAALSDPLGFTAQGLEVISYSAPAEALARIEGICRTREVNEIVVGIPLNMDGTEGPAALAAKKFAGRLAGMLKIPVHMVDERLSSRSAERILLEGNVSRRGRRENRDKLAAVLILESYLARRQNAD